VCFSFSTFFIFLDIFQCTFLIFHVFQFSRHISALQCVFVFFQLFQCFSSYSRSYSEHFSFSTFFECFSPYSRSKSVCISFSLLVSFLAIFLVLQCAFLIFLIFHRFSPYPRSYSVCVSFSTFFRFLAIIQFPISHFSRFSVFITIFRVLKCAFLIFYVY
jgi:hypothetical protein